MNKCTHFIEYSPDISDEHFKETLNTYINQIRNMPSKPAIFYEIKMNIHFLKKLFDVSKENDTEGEVSYVWDGIPIGIYSNLGNTVKFVVNLNGIDRAILRMNDGTRD